MFRSAPLSSNCEHLSIFVEDIVNQFDNADIKTNLKTFFNQKMPDYESGKAPGIMVFEHEVPKAVGVIDLVAPHYGNMTMHALSDEAAGVLASAFVDQGLLKDNLLELIQYKNVEPYKEAFIKKGMHSNFRQRMGIMLEDEWESPVLPPDTSFGPFDDTTVQKTGKISYLAHKNSQDQVGYVGLRSAKARAEIEQSLIDGKRGVFNPTASMTLEFMGDIIGFASVVDITCWGYKRVPWVFDLSVHPDFAGQGFGKLLILECMARLKAMEYPVIGLGVTVNNYPAVQLYQSLGYQVVEQFYEFTDQDLSYY